MNNAKRKNSNTKTYIDYGSIYIKTRKINLMFVRRSQYTKFTLDGNSD